MQIFWRVVFHLKQRLDFALLLELVQNTQGHQCSETYNTVRRLSLGALLDYLTLTIRRALLIEINFTHAN